MGTKKKKLGVYKTVITVEVLSDTPLNNESLETIATQTMTGDWSKTMTQKKSVELSKYKAIKECEKQGTDPSFFLLDDK